MKILIVEDEKDYRDLLQKKLSEQHDINVLVAENGSDALDVVLDNRDINLIVLDLLMPKMDGITFLYKLRNELKNATPVVILTNFSDSAYPVGVADFIVKSDTSLDEAVNRIKSHLNPILLPRKKK